MCLSHVSTKIKFVSFNLRNMMLLKGLPRWLSGKESTCYAGDTVLISELGRSTGGGHGNPLQYSWWENLMDRGAWWAMVHGITKSQTWLKQLNLHAHNALKMHWFIFKISFIIQVALSSTNSIEKETLGGKFTYKFQLWPLHASIC